MKLPSLLAMRSAPLSSDGFLPLYFGAKELWVVFGTSWTHYLLLAKANAYYSIECTRTVLSATELQGFRTGAAGPRQKRRVWGIEEEQVFL
jgi:hypothetical protein